jgi:predicted ABC-type ATPase
VAVGSDQTRLVVLRGNSGAGKSTVAGALREAYGQGVAWVSQDLIRRTILREKDRPGAVNIGLIGQVARYSLTGVRERVIPESSTLQETTSLILAETQLPQAARAQPGRYLG